MAEIFSGLQRGMDGTFAQYTVVPLGYLLRLPEEPRDALVAPILCGGVTVYKALKICGATAGQWVGFLGAGGGVGALGIQYAKAMGFRVVAVDVGDEKGQMCRKLGADVFIDLQAAQDIVKAVWDATNQQGVAAALVTAGSGKAYQDSMGILAPLGTMVCIGIPPPQDTVTFHPLSFISKGYKIVATAVGTRGDTLEAVDFVARGLVTPVVKEIGMEDLAAAIEQLASGKVRPSSPVCRLAHFLTNDEQVLGKFVVRLPSDDEADEVASGVKL